MYLEPRERTSKDLRLPARIVNLRLVVKDRPYQCDLLSIGLNRRGPQLNGQQPAKQSEFSHSQGDPCSRGKFLICRES